MLTRSEKSTPYSRLSENTIFRNLLRTLESFRVHTREEPVPPSPNHNSPNCVQEKDRHSQAQAGRDADEPPVSHTLE